MAFSFTKDAREEASRAKWYDKIDVKLVTVADLLKSKDERPVPWRLPEPAPVNEILRAPRSTDELPTPEALPVRRHRSDSD